MTAVEWLMTKLQSLGVTKEEHYELLCQLELEAKVMDKEQKKFIFECGRNFQLTGEGTFEEVYNETFKSK